MNNFHQMQVFIAVAEEGGFAAGARRLGISPPAVTRTVSALEERLGVKLLNRTTRYVRATEAGLRYLEDSRRVLELADQADEAAAGINAEPRGTLTITAPVMFGRLYVMPGINAYLRSNPGVKLEALFLDRPTNLVEEGIDVAIRIGELPDSSMRALKVGTVCHRVCAAPAYVEQHGKPKKPTDLKSHSLVISSAGGFSPGWRFNDSGSDTLIPVSARLGVSTNDAALEAAVQGLGITRLLSYQVAGPLARGELVSLLEDYQSAALPVHILHREGRHGSAKVRSFIDLLAQQLRGDPTINATGQR
ncbi:MAG: LysR family transcriptional regulator [Halieaceae bacterium]|nr:LysR family transcriptional regulator [Halieaceae bacterium]